MARPSSRLVAGTGNSGRKKSNGVAISSDEDKQQRRWHCGRSAGQRRSEGDGSRSWNYRLKPMAPMRRVPRDLSAALAKPTHDGMRRRQERTNAQRLSAQRRRQPWRAGRRRRRLSQQQWQSRWRDSLGRWRRPGAQWRRETEREDTVTGGCSRYQWEREGKVDGKARVQGKAVMAAVAVEAVSSAARRTAASRTRAAVAVDPAGANLPAIRKAASSKEAERTASRISWPQA